MASPHRRFKLAIWGLALGYFVFYVPYAALIKITTNGLWPGVSGPVSGFRLLPAVVISTAVVLPFIVSLAGWWTHAGRRQVFGRSIPFPRPLVFLSGLGTAIIIGTTTLIFTFPGVSIVFALVLMRGGVLLMGPVVDRVFKRRVRWFSWAAFAVTGPAILIALADVNNYRVSGVTAAIIIAYLSGYLLRIPCATKLAKSDDKATTYRYFVEEQMVAILFLVAITAVFALIGKGENMTELRYGFTGLLTSNITIPALIIGAFYACLYCFGTLIYLDCRENTYCIPLNRGSSLLAGFSASYLLTLFFGSKPPSTAQVGSAGLLIMALLLLSPFHHVLEHVLDKFRLSFARAFRTILNIGADWRRQPIDSIDSSRAQLTLAADVSVTPKGLSDLEQPDKPRRIFLFVCSGNTCRSPMAAAIAKTEIAARLRIPFENVGSAHVKAMSAGVTAKVGEPMTDEAKQALSQLGFHPNGHRGRSVTAELADQAEKIFCMTQAHRNAVLAMVPAVTEKTHCLDPDGDIPDPIGSGLETYVECAERIHALVRSRFDELNLQTGVLG